MKRIIIIAILPIFLVLLGELSVQAQDPTEGERIARLEEAYTHLATKEDLAKLRGELKADIATLQGELKAEIASLRGELRGMQWMLGGGFLILIAVTLWVNREKRSDPQPEPAPLSTNPQAQ